MTKRSSPRVIIRHSIQESVMRVRIHRSFHRRYLDSQQLLRRHQRNNRRYFPWVTHQLFEKVEETGHSIVLWLFELLTD